MTGKGTANVEIQSIDPETYQTHYRQRRQRPSAFGYKNSEASQTDSKMYLQVGAFNDRGNAEQLKQQLNELSGNVAVDTTRNGNNSIYRVRIGPLASAEEADRLASRITAQGFSEPHIVID